MGSQDLSGQRIVAVWYSLIGHRGVDSIAGLLETTESVEQMYNQYRKERRDLNDPYAFLQFCTKRYQATVVKYAHADMPLDYFHFSEQ